jgi:hypothetical protein
LVAQFDNFLAAIKERDRLNAEAKAKPQESAPLAKQYYIRSVDDLDGSRAKHYLNCKTPDGISFNVTVFDSLADARKERDRLNAEAKAALQPAADPVDAPDHYRQGEIECIDAVKAMLGAEGFAYWLRGNIVAYLWRLPHKGEAVKDAGKTRNLAERLVRLLGG